MSDTIHLIGAAAVALGVPEHVLRRLADDGTLNVPRVGRYRVFPSDRLDAYRSALEQAGYVKPAPPAAG